MNTKINYHLPLEPENFYHVFTRAVGDEKLFRNHENYRYFLIKLKEYTLPVCRYFSYTLLPNHFHLLIQIRNESELSEHYYKLKGEGIENYSKPLSSFVMQCFSNCLNGYTKAYNKMYDRKGALFMDYLKRSIAKQENDFTNFAWYIHKNAVHHGLTNNVGQWKYDSYNILCSNKKTELERKEVLNWFGGKEEFINFHQQRVEPKTKFYDI